MTTYKFAEQSTDLSIHVVELNRIDSAVVAAAKAGTALPAPDKIFGALSDATIASSDAIDTYRGRSVPESVRIDLAHLNVAIINLAASLKIYVTLGPRAPGSSARARSQLVYATGPPQKRVG